VAGQETTTTTLTWAIYLLSQTPDWCASLVADSERKWSAAQGAADRLVKSRRPVEEAMRLYAPIVA
jgi:cytochrome P450